MASREQVDTNGMACLKLGRTKSLYPQPFPCYTRRERNSQTLPVNTETRLAVDLILCRKWHIVRLAKISENARLRHMAACIVSYLDTEGLRHTVEVDAESLYEASVLALRTFRQHECEPGQASKLEVEIRSSITHTVTLRKIHDWVNGGAKTPKEAVMKEKLRALL